MNNKSILLLQGKIKDFIISQNVLSMVASVTIAVAAGTVIKSFVIDILFPTIDFVFKNKNNYKGKNRDNYDPLSYLHLIYFFKEVLNFIIVLIITFLFIYFFMALLFNIKEKDINNDSSSNSAAAGTAAGQQKSVKPVKLVR